MMNEKEFKPGDICRFVLTGDKCMVVKRVVQRVLVNSRWEEEVEYVIRLCNDLLNVYPCEIEAWVDSNLATKKADSIIDQLKEYAKKFNKQYDKKKTNSWIRDPCGFEDGPKVIPLLGK